MSEFLTLLISGAASGAIFAIMASGIVLTYETTGIFNFAHGAVAFTAAWLFYQLHTGQHIPIVPAGLLTIVVFGPALGLLLNRIMLRNLATAPVYARIVGTIGLYVALPNLALWIVEQVNDRGGNLPTQTQVFSAPGLGPTPAYHWTLMKGLVLDSDQLAIFAAALIAAAGLWFVLRHTRLGLLMRADVDKRELAILRGVNTGRISAVTWVLTMMLAALGGCLLAPSFGMDDLTFTLVVLGAMAAIVFAGLRSLPLAFIGGLLLGIVQNMVAGYGNDFLPGFLVKLSGFRTSVPFILTILALLVLARRKSRSAGSVAREAPAPDHRRGLPQWRRSLPWTIVVGALLIYTIAFSSSFWSGMIAQGLVFSIIFLSFVVVTGIGGMVSLAQASFVTTGAFMTGWLLKHVYANNTPLLIAHGHLNFLIAAVAAAVVAMLAGAVIAIPLRRLGALELALATLAIAFIADLVIFQVDGIRGGSNGYTVNPPVIGPFHFTDTKSLVVLLLLVFGLMTLVVINLQRSASGRAMYAARSSDVAARTSGLSPDRAKIAVFAVSAGIAGVGGAFYAVTASPFNNTTTPAFVGLIWLAVVVTLGVRRPAGAFLSGLTYGVGNAVFTKITGHAGVLHDMASSSHFLPILFGLGAINLAKNPDGALALTAQQRAERKQLKERRRELAVARASAGVGLTEGAAAIGASTDGASVVGTATVGATTDGPTTSGGASAGSTGGVLVQLSGITAAYGDVEVLHGVDLSIARGSILAMLGSNGAGKSTLCGVTAGLINPTRGTVSFEGEDVTAWPAYRRASAGIMLAPEARGVFPGLTVEENLSVWLPSPADRERAYEHFAVLGERRHQRAGLLSGGEQQILALASALVRSPKLFIADEPTLGLAPLAAARVCEILGQLRENGTSILLVEEKTAEVLELADTVALMQLGRIVWVGPRSDLDADSLTSAYLGGRTAQAVPS